MVLMSIDDSDSQAKKTTQTIDVERMLEPGAGPLPAAEPERAANAERDADAERAAEPERIERDERGLDPDVKRAQEAAHQREMMANLRRAADAARSLTDLRGEDEPEIERESADRSASVEPTASAELTESVDPPHIPALALRCDGKALLSVTHLAGADLSGRETWVGVVLHEEEALGVLGRVSNACDEAAGYAAAGILWSGKRGEGGGKEGGGHG
jgi:hypothetical protein